MSNILSIAVTTEGSTDVRFLGTILSRTFEAVAAARESAIDVRDIVHLPKGAQPTFIEQVENAARKAIADGIHILCIHADADARMDTAVFERKIIPARVAVENIEGTLVIVAVVPVQMTEAWMLADKELLRAELRTNESLHTLGLDRAPEAYADPKTAIEDAIRIAQEKLSARRRRLKLAELYQPLGQRIPLERLMMLTSFQKFKQEVEAAFDVLNYW